MTTRPNNALQPEVHCAPAAHVRALPALSAPYWLHDRALFELRVLQGGLRIGALQQLRQATVILLNANRPLRVTKTQRMARSQFLRTLHQNAAALYGWWAARL